MSQTLNIDALTLGHALLALDIDGTLLTRDYRVLPEVRAAIAHARRHGVQVALVSARSLNGVRTVLNDLGHMDHIICFGGSLVLSAEKSDYRTRPSADQSLVGIGDALQVARRAKNLGLAIAAYTTQKGLLSCPDATLAKRFEVTAERYDHSEFESLAVEPLKLLVVSREGEISKLDDLAKMLPLSVEAVRSYPTHLEIVRAGISKGAALAALTTELGLKTSQVAAIGDSENDEAMLGAVGYPIAMGNATAALKELAAWTTATCDDAGVAHAISHLSKHIWNIPSFETTASHHG